MGWTSPANFLHIAHNLLVCNALWSEKYRLMISKIICTFEVVHCVLFLQLVNVSQKDMKECYTLKLVMQFATFFSRHKLQQILQRDRDKRCPVLCAMATTLLNLHCEAIKLDLLWIKEAILKGKKRSLYEQYNKAMLILFKHSRNIICMLEFAFIVYKHVDRGKSHFCRYWLIRLSLIKLFALKCVIAWLTS